MVASQNNPPVSDYYNLNVTTRSGETLFEGNCYYSQDGGWGVGFEIPSSAFLTWSY